MAETKELPDLKEFRKTALVLIDTYGQQKIGDEMIQLADEVERLLAEMVEADASWYETTEQLRAQNAEMREALEKAALCIALYASCIKSGEDWSLDCQDALEEYNLACLPLARAAIPTPAHDGENDD